MSKPVLEWKLNKLYPAQFNGECLTTVKSWFKPDRSCFRQNYNAHGVLHRGQINKFTRLDRTKGTKWRKRYAKQLMSVRHSAMKASKLFMQEYGMNTWLTLNCAPCGGKWITTTAKDGGTGYPCKHRLCPWCYLRRHIYLKEYIASDKVIEGYSGNESIACLGLGEKVDIMIFQLTSPYLLPNERGPDWLLTKSATSDRIGSFIKYCDTYIRKTRPFSLGVKLVTPVAIPAREGQPTLVGARIAFIFKAVPDATPGIITLPEASGTQANRICGLDLGDALRLGAPFPLRLLAQSNDPEEGSFVRPFIVRELLQAFDRRQSFNRFSTAG